MKNPSTLLDPRHSKLWYDDLVHGRRADLNWRGVCIVKHPNDLFCYQEIIHETKPDLIVETGTFLGGSALFLADMLELEGNGRVVSIDLVTDRELPEHDRIDYLLGLSSTDPLVLVSVAARAGDGRCMVILDSAHNKRHVLNELEVYAPLVTKGCYLIVEDSNVDGYRLAVGDIEGEGPAEALKEWQPTNRGFEVDRWPERIRMTQNPGGYLRRVR